MSDTRKRRPAVDLQRIRGKLDRLEGRKYWRSLEELAGTPEFESFLHREFPENASEWTDPKGRRDFLRLMGASLALAGLGACTKQPLEKIVPYVRQPEEIVPGRPLFYATALEQAGYGLGVLVESHLGRPTKIEGNPDHPASLGATNALGQASILGLYDPDRSQVVRKAGRISTWDTFLQELSGPLETQRARGGRGLRILTGSITSPTLAALLEQLERQFPEARWHQWQPAGRDNVHEGARLSFGLDVDTHYDLSQADVIVSLGADFLGSGAGSVRYANDFALRRRVLGGEGAMNRLYVLEPTPSITGSMADHRLPLPAGRLENAALSLAAQLGVPVPGGQTEHEAWLTAAARDLQSRGARGLVIAGDEAPPNVHALAHACNHFLGAVGNAVVHTEAVEARPVRQLESIRELAADMGEGRVELLLMLGGNPVYDAPADLEFASRLDRVPLRIHCSAYEDETSARCHWHLPATHSLESWGDVRAYDGTATIQQPLIAPLFGGKSNLEVAAALLGRGGASSHDLVKEHWRGRHRGGEFEPFWLRSVHDGVVEGTRAAALVPAIQTVYRTVPETEGYEVIFRADPSVGDGEFSNNGWMQELPKPFTKLTWDNAVLIAPATAQELGLATGDRVALTLGERSLQGPAWIVPGQAAGTVCVHLGYGRTHAGRVGNGAGFDAYPLRTSSGLWQVSGVEVSRGPGTHRFASTQSHFAIEVEASAEAERRHLVREGTLEEYREHPEFVHEMGHEFGDEYSLFPRWKYEGYAWGMTIDLGACTGCNACVVACQSENNIPVVGKDQVELGREMHWIRVDGYFHGDLDNPHFVHQPMPCQHCENAPCEVVCPVAATTHSAEGINEMTYNRCVGTRYCSNNCPYKVRRFNFLLYQDWDTPSLKLMRNPDVSVRSRGVMEKCSYCVQRINAARIQAKIENRRIRDGEVRTACQAVCPSRAISFGDINDPDSEVSRWKADPLEYGILSELQTRPRTTYLARLRNPNPEMPNE